MLLERIEKDYIIAYKAKEETKIRTLRLVKSAIKNLHVALLRSPTEEEVQILLIKQTKQRKDSIEQFMTANRPDLAKKEQEELDVLTTYLPKQLTGEELLEIVNETIQKLGATSAGDMGKVMGYITKAYAGKVDGKELSELVKKLLSQ